jgi:hypothetical protein
LQALHYSYATWRASECARHLQILDFRFWILDSWILGFLETGMQLQPDLSGFPAGQIGQPFDGWLMQQQIIRKGVSTSFPQGFSHWFLMAKAG